MRNPMDIKSDHIRSANRLKEDAPDIPDCFGEFDIENRLCFTYCAISIRCSVMQTLNPKIDILEKLLIYNDYSVKPH